MTKPTTYTHQLSDTYVEFFRLMKIDLISPYVRSHDKCTMLCQVCNHEFSATPLAKVNAYKKHQAGGCPACTEANRSEVQKRAAAKRTQKTFEQFWDSVKDRIPSTVEVVSMADVEAEYYATLKDAVAGTQQNMKVEWKCTRDSSHPNWKSRLLAVMQNHTCTYCARENR